MFAIFCSMWIYKRTGNLSNPVKISILIYALFLPVLTYSAVIDRPDTLIHKSLHAWKQISSIAVIDFFTTFASINEINGENENERNSLYLYYNFSVNNKLTAGKFVMLNYYFTELGLKKFIDSISSFSEDQYNFKNSISYRIGKSRFAMNFCINSKSQYFNHYDFRKDSLGQWHRYLFSSYLSPGYTNFSGGIRYEFKNNMSLEFGLVNGRKTKIKKQELFEIRGENQLYGLSKGNSHKIDLGLNLVFSLPSQQINKHLYLEDFSQLNVDKNNLFKIKNYMFDINNAFHYKFLKHFRLTLRTKILYDNRANPKPKLTNQLTLGFYLNNTF